MRSQWLLIPLTLANSACLVINYPQAQGRYGNDFAAAAPIGAPASVTAALAAGCYSKTTPDMSRLLTFSELYRLPNGTELAFPTLRESRNVELERVTIRSGQLRGREVWICLADISGIAQPL